MSACQSNMVRGFGTRFPIGFCSTGLGRRRGPISLNPGKRQVVEVAGDDGAARVELGVNGGDLWWGSRLIFCSYGNSEA
jgi:hypothetical protein